MAVRYKVVPPVHDVAFLRAVAGAVPLVPGPEADCCTRIRDRTDVPTRDEATEWLTFCRALGLVREADSGYHRVRDEPGPAALADEFRERVFGAREALAGVAGGGTVDDAFAAVRTAIPEWERARHDDWKATWRERTRRLLGWAVEFGIARRVDDRTGEKFRYSAAED
jgi:hypothetical protein